jgi:hypothetical protein
MSDTQQPLIHPSFNNEEEKETSNINVKSEDAAVGAGEDTEEEEYHGMRKLCEMATWEWRVLSLGAKR